MDECPAGINTCGIHYDKALDGPISAEWQCPEHDLAAPHHTDGTPCGEGCKAPVCSNCGGEIATWWKDCDGLGIHEDDSSLADFGGKTGRCGRKAQENPGPVGEDVKPFTEDELRHAELNVKDGQFYHRGWKHRAIVFIRSLQEENKELQAIIDDPDTNPAYNSCACRFDGGEMKQECKVHQDLRKEREICRGETKDLLDGKPMPGDWQDGTDGACPGWWRGQDDGVRGACQGLLKLFRNEGYQGVFSSSDMQEVEGKIKELSAQVGVLVEASIIESRNLEDADVICLLCGTSGHEDSNPETHKESCPLSNLPEASRKERERVRGVEIERDVMQTSAGEERARADNLKAEITRLEESIQFHLNLDRMKSEKITRLESDVGSGLREITRLREDIERARKYLSWTRWTWNGPIHQADTALKSALHSKEESTP